MTPSTTPNEPRPCLVRTALPSDLTTVVEFNCALALESEDLVLDPVAVTRGVRAVFESAERGTYYIAQVDDEPVGQLMITREWTDWRNGWFWWIQSVYVEPAWRRRGVLRALYDHVASLVDQRGDVRGLRLYVVDTNATAMEAYTRLGMTRTDYRLYETGGE